MQCTYQVTQTVNISPAVVCRTSRARTRRHSRSANPHRCWP